MLYTQTFQSSDEPATGCHRRILEKNPDLPFKLILVDQHLQSGVESTVFVFMQSHSIGTYRELVDDVYRHELLTKSIEPQIFRATKGDHALSEV